MRDPWLGIKLVPPAVEEQSLNYWTNREIPWVFFFLKNVHICITKLLGYVGFLLRYKYVQKSTRYKLWIYKPTHRINKRTHPRNPWCSLPAPPHPNHNNYSCSVFLYWGKKYLKFKRSKNILEMEKILIQHFLFVSEVTQSCPTLCDPMDCSLPGSSVHGIFQARIVEWVAISFSRRSSQPRDGTWVSRIVGRRFTVWATREVQNVQ